MKKLLLSIVTMLFCAYNINAQINPNTLLPDVLPMNPQVSEFMKYGEIPVNNYTGTPNINIPIYNLKTKGINIPIALSYHASGVKVNEEASWVGLGWNLNTDMQIVQTVVGFDDFGYYGNRLTPNYDCLIPTQTGGLTASSVMSGNQTFFLGFDDQWNQNNPSCFFDPNYFAGTKDSEPDIFYFNALGYSGKFILDWETGNYVCLTDKRIKISPNTGSTPSDFIITVADGHRFLFELKEETKVNRSYTTSPTGGGVSTNVDLVNRNEKSSRVYKLTQVVTNKAEVIDFNYTTTTSSKNFPNINITYRNYNAKEGAGSNFIPGDIGHSTSFFATEQPFSYLSSITYDDVEVKFLTSSRVDLKEAKRLDKIEVWYKTNLINDYTFDYSHFIGNNSGNNWDSYLSDQGYIHGKTSTELTHRLKLDSLKFKTQKPYVFTYDATSLPKKTSYATDYWGYYNGQHNNSSFFPNIYRFNVERDNPNYLNYNNNNKSSDVNFVKAGTLVKVTYPTGGGTIYDYELNSFDNYKAPSTTDDNKKSISISTTTNQANYPTSTILLKGGATFFKGSALLSVRGCTSLELNTAYADTYVKIYSFKESLLPIVESSQYYSVDHALSSLGLIVGSSNFNQTNFNLYIDKEEVIQMQQNGDLEQHFSDLLYTFNKGVVRFETYGGCGTYNGITNSSQAFLNLTYMDYQPLIGDSFGAGLRIKTVANYTNANYPYSAATQKTYEYEGGKLMTPLLYFNKTDSRHFKQDILSIVCSDGSLFDVQTQLDNAWQDFTDNPTETNAQKIMTIIHQIENTNCTTLTQDRNFIGYKNELFSGSYIQSSGNASGRFVGYDKVTVTSDNTTQNGKIVYNYVNNPDQSAPGESIGDGYFTAINVPLTKNYPENGNLLEQETFDKNNNLKQKIINQYTSAMENSSWGMKTITTDTYANLIVGGGGLSESNSKYLTGVYPIKSGVTLLEKQTSIFYEGGNSLINEVEYFYDDKNHLISSKEKTSKDEIIETTIKYPYNYTQFPYSYMTTDNFLTPIVEKEVKLNSERIELQNFLHQRDYITHNNINTYIYPIYKFSLAKGADALEDRIIYHSYDERGNPQIVSKKDGTKTYYVWGYDQTFPIAKIEGYISLSASQTTLINNAISASNSDVDRTIGALGLEGDLRSKLQLLRDGFASTEAQVTTLTYDPLIGVTSVTDPRDRTAYYLYDSFNRLQYIKDHEGNILSENQYNYKN